MGIDLDKCITAIAADDRDALRTLYEELRGPIYFYALSILRNEEEAKDVMQEAFLKIRVSARLYRPKSNAKAWIFKIARNLAMDVFRNRRELADIEDCGAIEDSGGGFEDAITGSAAAFELMSILNRDEREIVSLHLNGGLSHHETARTLAMPYEQVKWKYTYALRKLRNHLGKDGPT